jgi:protein-tyrosine phosphatase
MSIPFQPENYRDVGEALGLWLEPSPVQLGKLIRGGKFDVLFSAADLGNPRTILNLRRGADPRHLPDITYLHIPAANDLENYDTSQRSVQIWLGNVLGVLANPSTAWPVYLHCTSGRDRTGIVVAAVLLLLDVPRPIIVEEFLLSNGAQQSEIECAIDGLTLPGTLRGVDRARLREALSFPQK